MGLALRVAFLAFILGPWSFYLDYYVLKFPLATTLALLYSFTYVNHSEQNCGKENLVVRRWRIWNYLKRYFDAKLIKTCELDPEKRYLFAIHPHGKTKSRLLLCVCETGRLTSFTPIGVLPLGSALCLCQEETPNSFCEQFPGIRFRFLCATFCFFVPLYRELLLYAGFADASKFSASRLFQRGYSVALVPGGATEALYSSPDRDVIYLSKRKGFIRLAMEHGVALVPVFSFNENNMFMLYIGGNSLINTITTKFQKVFGISLPLLMNLIPKKTQIRVVVGRPLQLPHLKNPSSDQVDEFLEQYKGLLKELYYQHKQQYNIPSSKELLII